MTNTRVIALPPDLPAAPPKRPDDRNDAAGPSVVQGRMGRRGQPDAGSPGEAALVALVKLLARQAADADFRSQGW
jgi:hypothetical protein